MKEYLLVILEAKVIIKPNKIYDKFNQLYSIKQYFEKIKLFLNNYTDEDFDDLNDPNKNIQQTDLFQKYNKQFNNLYYKDDNGKGNKNKQGDSVKNLIYDITNETLNALRNLNTDKILYFFGGDKIHDYSIKLINDFNKLNKLDGWIEYNNHKNLIRKLDYSDINNSTIPLKKEFMTSIYCNIGYVDLEDDIVVSNKL